MHFKFSDLEDLRRFVESEVDSYIYEVSGESVGNPWSDQKVQTGIQRMRAALVEPYWTDVELRDTYVLPTPPLKRRCAVVADDGRGTLLLWDPETEYFVLADRDGADLFTYNVRGDAVGCFLAI
jgi:hypothetical protein